jgi:hypothetical protein
LKHGLCRVSTASDHMEAMAHQRFEPSGRSGVASSYLR